MNVLISDNIRCSIAPDGSMWSPDMTRGYDAWKAYLEVFEEVRVLVRARLVDRPPKGWSPVCGPGVCGAPVPYFRGPWQLAPRYVTVKRAIQGALDGADAISMRVPATISQLVWGGIQVGRPYGVHVTGDPFEALAPGLHGDISRCFFRRLYTHRLRRQTAGACAIAYVTSESLQRTYPPPSRAFCTHFSNAVLPGAAFVCRPREARPREGPFRLVMVASLANLIKRPDVFLESIGICLRAGLDLRAAIVGDGVFRPKMEALSRNLELQNHVRFTGQLSMVADVRHQLDAADLFVLPSKTEGLPRAMLEAMARAVPCIGTTVGGIPELLPPADLVPTGDARQLAQKILEAAADPGRLARMSRRCFETAQAYRDVEIQRRRNTYCEALRRRTEDWLRVRQCAGASRPVA